MHRSLVIAMKMEATFYCTPLLAFAILLFLWKNFRNKSHSRLPPSCGLALPIIGHLYLMKPPVHQTLTKLSARYGPILFLRFGSRPVLVVSSHGLIAECLTTNDIVFANRPNLIAGKYFGYNETGLVFSSYGPHWRNLRRIVVNEILSTSRISALSNARATELRYHLRHLYNEATNCNSTANMRKLLFNMTFNIMMRMVFGKSYWGEGAIESHKFVKCIQDAFQMSGGSNLEDFVPLLRWVTKLEKKMATLTRDMDELFDVMIGERRREIMELYSAGGGAEVDDRKSVVDVLLELQRGHPDYYSDETIKGIIMVIFFGGTETSSNTVEWAMALMLNHPQVLEKAAHEIDKNVTEGQIVTDRDLPNLPYLANIIKETLRLFPPGLLPHFSSEECTVGGFNIPSGTMVLFNMYAMQRDPKIWENPNEFMPERFEGEVEAYKSISFGLGRRRCPGENLGMTMTTLTLANLIKCFEWERIGENLVDLTESDALTLPMANPLVAKYKPRSTMIDVLSQL